MFLIKTVSYERGAPVLNWTQLDKDLVSWAPWWVFLSTAKISVVVSNLYDVSEKNGQPKTSEPKIENSGAKICTITYLPCPIFGTGRGRPFVPNPCGAMFSLLSGVTQLNSTRILKTMELAQLNPTQQSWSDSWYLLNSTRLEIFPQSCSKPWRDLQNRQTGEPANRQPEMRPIFTRVALQKKCVLKERTDFDRCVFSFLKNRTDQILQFSQNQENADRPDPVCWFFLASNRLPTRKMELAHFRAQNSAERTADALFTQPSADPRWPIPPATCGGVDHSQVPSISTKMGSRAVPLKKNHLQGCLAYKKTHRPRTLP